MADEFIYAVSRFNVDTDEEVLAEHAELVRENGNLVLRVDRTPDRALSTNEVREAIIGEPVLSDIHANQVTRIKASGVAFDHLPFVLHIPGDPEEFDEKSWSEAQADEHTRQDWVVQPGRCRVAYVNGSRWCPWPTDDGPRMLPEEWPVIGLSSTWARLTFCETASMTSGTDEVTLGLVTPRVVAACRNPDSGSLTVAVWPRNGDSAGDAEIFVRWLLDLMPESYSRSDGFKALMAQLFVEAACHDRSGEELSGSSLAAGWDVQLGFGDTDTSEWNLELDLPGSAAPLALDLIERQGGRLSAMVSAGRLPNSTEGNARRAALKKLEVELATAAAEPTDESDDEPDESGDYDDEDQEEPDEQTNELNGRRILELLAEASEDGIGIERIARSLGISDIAVVAAVRRLHGRHQIVLTSDSSIVWLPERRLSWLMARSPKTPSISEEIERLLEMHADQRRGGEVTGIRATEGTS